MRFVALFLLVFALADVCVPEDCGAQILGAATGSCQARTTHDSNSDNSCQFEEDCFNCAHFAPGATFTLRPVAAFSFEQPDLVPSLLAGSPLIPYHPPRA